MEEMKAALAIACCLFGNDYIIDHKFFKGYSIYLIGCCFHFTAALMFITPFVLFLKLNYKGVLILFLSFFVSYVILTRFEDYLVFFEFSDALSDKASFYAESDTYMGERNINNSILGSFPYLLYAVIAILYIKKHDKNSHLLKFEPMLMMGMIFLTMKFFVLLFARLVHYYSLYLIMIYAYLFVDTIKKTRRLDIKLSYAKTFSLFIPLFLAISLYYIRKVPRFYPYNSVLNREINRERENHISEIHTTMLIANMNEY